MPWTKLCLLPIRMWNPTYLGPGVIKEKRGPKGRSVMAV